MTTWATATFDHVVNGVTPGSCVTCHNGVQALGKPTNHIPTAGLPSAACDACHTTSARANISAHQIRGISLRLPPSDRSGEGITHPKIALIGRHERHLPH